MSDSSNTTYIPTTFGASSFRLKHNQEPIFFKIFNGNSDTVIDFQDDTIFIKDHFFKTGERLKYKFPDSGQPIQISPSSPGNAISTSILPSEVYPIVVDSNTIKLAFSRDLALTNQPIDILGVGVGTEHSFECEKQNSKCLITIDNIIQSPISIGSTVEILSINDSRTLTLKSMENISAGTILKIDSEYCKVISTRYSSDTAGIGTVSLLRGEFILGSPEITFTNNIKYVTIMYGQYNIVKDRIYFTESPFSVKGFKYTISLDDVNQSNFSFNLFNANIKTGSLVTLNSQNPPSGLQGGKIYFIIKNYENNFSFATSYNNAVNGIKIEFDKSIGNNFPLNPVSALSLSFLDFSFGSSFSGRAFLRSNYSGNAVFDDISGDFNGITTSFELKNSGISTVGISSDNGVVLINNIFQYPEFEESFTFREVGNQTYLDFIGIGTDGDGIKDYDVNVKGFPRGGIIAGYGLSSGTNYQPLKTAILYETNKIEVSPNNYTIDSTNIGIAYSGSGYRYPVGSGVSVYFEQNGNRISGYGTATINSGNIVSITITDPCLYTGISTPRVRIDSPLEYDNINVSGSSSGVGAKVKLSISDSGEIDEFRFSNPGYGYTVGEVLTLPDLLGYPDQTESQRVKISILSVGKDSFSAWNIGQLKKLDDLTPFVNGVRKVFNLTENSQLVSLETLPGSNIDIKQNVLVFFNDVLQIPEESYIFEGGSQLIMSEAPPVGSTLKVYFYMGSDGDAIFYDIDPKIKVGDTLKVKKKVERSPETQFNRTVKRILSSDTLKTEIYNKKGLSPDSITFRPVDFTPQSRDLIISGELISKSRDSLKSRYVGFTSISTKSGTFNGISTTLIGINTSNIQVGDYLESDFTDGYRVTSIGSGVIGISHPATNTSTGTYPIKVWRKL